MKATLHGVRRVDMTDRETHRQICGYSLFLSYPAEGVQGEEVSRQFISDEFCASLQVSPPAFVGKPVIVDFTPRGKLVSLSHAR